MKNNFYISLGVWIAILPFLGIPGVWKNGLVSISGLFLIMVFIGPTILKKLQTKPKPKKKKENINPSLIQVKGGDGDMPNSLSEENK